MDVLKEGGAGDAIKLLDVSNDYELAGFLKVDVVLWYVVAWFDHDCFFRRSSAAAQTTWCIRLCLCMTRL